MRPADASRAAHLDALGRGVEVLVTGGGITGAGVALDAASRGYRVGLVERADFASGTSSRSTKLIHGGIRYLPQGHLGLVREGLRERTRLLRLAPYLVRPLPFLIPLYADLRRPLGVRVPAAIRPLAPWGIRAGLFAYDLFAGSPDLRHRPVSRAEVERLLPDLRTDRLRAALLYHDARADDVRLTHAVLATARFFGALTVNHAAVTALVHGGGRVTGARVEDRLSGRSVEVGAKFVVNATGIWGEQVAALDREPPFRIRHSKGAHLVLRPGAVACSVATVIPETDDGRLAFIVPWLGRPLLGTTDDRYEGDLDAPTVTAADVAYLLDHANRYLRRPLEPGDVAAAFAGIRPLVAAAGAASTSGLARDHVVTVSPSGLISVVGGKLTSYRRMAEDTVDAVVARDGGRRPCMTAAIPLVGVQGLDQARIEVEAAPLDPDQKVHLLEAYGSSAREVLALMRAAPDLAGRLVPGLPILAAEVSYACRAEQAVDLVDVMFLRARVAAIDQDAAGRAVDAVASIMSRELGWDAAEAGRQREAFEAALDRERAWKAARPP
jgi:glycerol-3-phosphate dehydrogenase